MSGMLTKRLFSLFLIGLLAFPNIGATSSVARSIAGGNWTAGNVVNCAGTTGAAITACIAAASSGDTIQLASNEYLITSAITVNKNLNIVGQGVYPAGVTTASSGTIIKTATASIAGMFTVPSGYKVRIANLSIYGGADNVRGIQVSGTNAFLVAENITITLIGGGTMLGIYFDTTNASGYVNGDIRDTVVNVTSTDSTAMGIGIINRSTTATSNINLYNVKSTSSGTNPSRAFSITESSASTDTNFNVYDSVGVATGATTNNHGLFADGDNAKVTIYDSSLSGSSADISQSNSAVVTISSVNLVNNSVVGSIVSVGNTSILKSSNVKYVAINDSIATAITAATAGDTLVLASGTYTVTSAITVNKALNIVGSDSSNGTTINSTTNGLNLFNITADNVTIKNLKVTYTAQGNMRIFYINATGGTVFSNVKLENINATLTNSVSGFGVVADYADAGGEVRNCNFTNSGVLNVAIQEVNSSTAEAATNLYIYNTKVTNTGATTATGVRSQDSSATQDSTVYIYNSTIISTRSSGTAGYGVDVILGSNAKMYVYNSYISGQDADVAQAASATLSISGVTLANNTTSGTITYNSWQTWTPTLTWTTGTPATPTTVARYTLVGNICRFHFESTSADGNGGTALTVTLPFTPKDTNSMLSVSSVQLQNATYTNPLGYIDATNDTPASRLLTFRSLSTCTDGEACNVYVDGSYEI